MRRIALAAVLLGGSAARARAYEWTTLGGITALGGVHAFNGSRGSFSGNLDAQFAPAVKLTERWSLLPSLVGEYEGARPLVDPLGTATPNQQRAEARAGARGIYAEPGSRWRFKPSLSYDYELLRETSDEGWGQGLFDRRRVSVGGEIERLTDEDHSVRLSAGWFSAQYPNYTTLESQAALQFQGQSLSRELVGDRALDHEGYQFSLSGDAPLGTRAVGEARAGAIWSRFARQRLVDEGGQFQSDTRQDVLFDAAFTARMPHEWNADLRAYGALELGLLANSSNQNGYDATRGKFMPGFYDFYEWRAVPSVSLVIGPVRRPVTATVRLGVRRRSYPHRAPQDSQGAYVSGSLETTEWTGGLSLDYPMAKRLSLVFSLERGSSSSNTDFQPFYRYSYEATTALAGVRWDW